MQLNNAAWETVRFAIGGWGPTVRLALLIAVAAGAVIAVKHADAELNSGLRQRSAL